MQLYENAFPSTYEEIKTWYPVWYRDVFEMDALWQVFGGQMDKIQADIIQMVNNNFIDFADADTITRLENFLSIVHPFPRSLAERRAVLRGFVLGLGHIGRQTIIELISLFTSGEIDVAFSRPGRITVTVTHDFGDMFRASDIFMILGHRIPAHLALDIIDLPQPVRVQNRNQFVFRDLLMVRFRIVNRTARIITLNGERLLDGTWLLDSGTHGIRFVDFNVKARIANRSPPVFKKRLDGSRIIDGSWRLNGGLYAPLRGMSAREFKAGAYKFNTANRLGTAVLTRSEDFLLDGKAALDGTQTLNGKFITQEDI